jgi:hypothetical protein
MKIMVVPRVGGRQVIQLWTMNGNDGLQENLLLVEPGKMTPHHAEAVEWLRFVQLLRDAHSELVVGAPHPAVFPGQLWKSITPQRYKVSWKAAKNEKVE